MSSYADLLKQRDELEKQIEAVRQNEIKKAVADVRALIDLYGLSMQDVFPSSKQRVAKTTGKVAAKFRDPVTGATWTGRGKAPKWIDGKNRDQFLI